MKHPKQERYKNEDGTDFLEEFMESHTVAEVRGAMLFTIGKYQSRLGKKDAVVNEVRKMADYAARWLKYEEELNDGND